MGSTFIGCSGTVHERLLEPFDGANGFMMFSGRGEHLHPCLFVYFAA